MTQFKVINILEDGTELDSMKGVVLPKDLSDKVILLLLSRKRNEVQPHEFSNSQKVNSGQ